MYNSFEVRNEMQDSCKCFFLENGSFLLHTLQESCMPLLILRLLKVYALYIIILCMYVSVLV